MVGSFHHRINMKQEISSWSYNIFSYNCFYQFYHVSATKKCKAMDDVLTWNGTTVVH